MTALASRALRATLLALSLALAIAACGARPEHARPLSIDELRRAAAESPNDPDAQRRLAEAELLMAGGDAARAREQIGRALRLAQNDPGLLLMSGIERVQHGEPAVALDRFLDALDAASASRRPDAPWIAEVAAAGVEELVESAPEFDAKVRPRYERRRRDPGNIGLAAKQRIAEALIELAYRRGDAQAAARLAAAQGCVTSWRVAGPFGPHDLLGFDERHPAERTGPLADTYDLGPGLGVRPTRTVEARGCAVHVGGSGWARGGTTFAETFVTVARGGAHVLRLETPNAVELFVDGRSVLRLDMRRDPTPRITYHRIDLPAGRHEITAKIATRHPNPILGLVLVPAEDDGAGTGMPEGEGPFASWLSASVSTARADAVAAREALRGVPERDGSATVLILRSVVAVADPLNPPETRRDEARRLLRAAARRDSRAWYPELQLARLDAADGRIVPAIQRLRRASRRWPELAAIPLTLADLLLAQGWEAEADRAVRRAREIVPDGCGTLNAALAIAKQRDRVEEVGPLVDAVLACDARSEARFASLVEQRRWDDAARELDRLASLEPPQSRARFLSAKIQVANGRGAVEDAERMLAELRQELPLSAGLALEQADRLLASDRRADARQLLDRELAREPAAMAELHRVQRVLGEPWALGPYRLDGARIIRDFEASGRTYDQPQVLVLDYTVVRVFEDGSSLELTHNIYRVQSQEAADELGEFSPPDGAEVLRLHTIKADGRRLEPDAIAGKDTISLPRISPGDYVEYEYVRASEAAPAFANGYLGSRFYFQSFEVPFDRSELTIVLPRSMEPVVDPRGPAPRMEERVDGDVRVLHWLVSESRPLVQEPASVAPREYIPSVNVGVRATWPRFVDGLRDVLLDRDVRDPAARRLALGILGDTRRGDATARARKLYAWVLENIEENGEAFGLAPAMLADRAGNRARVLHYLLGLVGVPSKLVAARGAGADQTRSDLADDETYQNMLVMLGEGDRAVFLFTGERGAPFGYVPPVLRGQDALVLAEGAQRVQIPAGRDGEDRRSVQARAQLARDGSARVEVVETFRGAGAVSWRGQLEGIPAAVLEQRLEEGYVSRLVPGATLVSMRIDGRESPEEPLVLRYVFDVPALGRRQGAAWIVPGLFPSMLAPSYARLPARTTAQLNAPPTDLDVSIEIVLPDGARIARSPSPAQVRGPGNARFTSRAQRTERGIRVDRSVRIPLSRIAPDEYPGFATFARGADEAEAREIAISM